MIDPMPRSTSVKVSRRQRDAVHDEVVAVELTVREADLHAVDEPGAPDDLMLRRGELQPRLGDLTAIRAVRVRDLAVVERVAREDPVGRRELMIDSRHQVMLVGVARVLTHELRALRVEHGAVRRRKRIQVRTHDRTGGRAHGVGGHDERVRLPEAFPDALVGGEEERPIPEDRAAGGEAELVAVEVGLRQIVLGCLPTPGVQLFVPMELEERSVKRVRAGLGRGVHDRSGMPAVLRAERVRQHLELADGLHAEHVPRCAAGLVELIVHHRAVEREQVLRIARTIHADLLLKLVLVLRPPCWSAARRASGSRAR